MNAGTVHDYLKANGIDVDVQIKQGMPVLLWAKESDPEKIAQAEALIAAGVPLPTETDPNEWRQTIFDSKKSAQDVLYAFLLSLCNEKEKILLQEKIDAK